MNHPIPAHNVAGLTLVELLVAMTLLATLTAGGLAAYARATASWRWQAAEQRRYERGQYVFGTLEPDLQMAGYFGAADVSAALPVAVPASLQACGIDIIARLDRPIESLKSLPAACVPRRALLAGNDVLVVRRLSARVAAPRSGRAQWLTTGGTGVNGALLWDGLIPAGVAGAELRDLIVRIYYVARHADGDAGTPALRVKSLTEVAGVPAFVDTEVMPGVESLVLEPLPQSAPQSVRITLRIRADAAETNTQDTRRSLSLTRHYTVRNTLLDPA
jgi:Prokaryotic N-terminal methylation motif